MKTASQLRESIDRFRRGFWGKESGGRPPIGVVNTDVYLPLKYLCRPMDKELVGPEDVTPQRVMTDYEFAFVRRPVNCDDWIPFAAPWRAIPWMEAWCGCPVRHSQGSLAPEAICETLEALAATPLPGDDRWFDCLREQAIHLAANLPEDCWLSPTILRGASDVLSAMRGLTMFLCDLCDGPAIVKQAAQRVNQLLRRAIDLHFSIAKPKMGGYGHIFGYWAAGPTIAIQEDVLGLCNPAIYRELFANLSREIVRHLGEHVIFHMHSTGFAHYQHVLEVSGLAGIQMTIEANGPALLELVPVFRRILERSRLMIFADHRFDELSAVLPKLPAEGLYIVVPERFIGSESAFMNLLTTLGWRGK